ncbi:MAG: hypothetical protein WHS77_02830 [Brevinematales bacterium]
MKLTKNNLLETSNEELAKFFLIFKPDKDEVRKFLEVLEETVCENPEKFIKNLNPFLKSPYLYVNKIVYSLIIYYLDNKRKINLNKIFDFLIDYINSTDFWTEKYDLVKNTENSKYYTILETINNFIITQNVKILKGFSKTYLIKAIKLMLLIIDKLLTFDTDCFNNDSLIVNPVEQTIQSLLVLGIRHKILRQRNKINNASLEKEIINRFNIIFKKKLINFYKTFGINILPFYFLEEKWTKNKVKEILNDDYELWDSFMTNYLFNNKAPHPTIYLLMKENYEKALDYDYKTNVISFTTIDHIILQYFNDVEKIDYKNGLLRKIFDEYDFEKIHSFLYNLWIYCINNFKPYRKRKKIREKIRAVLDLIEENKIKYNRLLEKDEILNKLKEFLPKKIKLDY